MRKNNSKGFTLIELMMIVAILGLTSSLIMASVNDARKKSRDAKRISDMAQIQKTLEMFLDKEGRYPNFANDAGGWDIGCGTGDSFIDELKPNYFSQVPTDQIGCNHDGASGYWYGYHRYDAGENGCPAERGSYYVLGVFDLETSSRPSSQSPGFRCSGKNWQDGFDWVAGGFEK